MYISVAFHGRTLAFIRKLLGSLPFRPFYKTVAQMERYHYAQNCGSYARDLLITMDQGIHIHIPAMSWQGKGARHEI